MGTVHLPGLALPFALIIDREAEAADQAVGIVERHVGVEWIGKVVIRDRGIGELRLRRDRPVAVENNLLARLKAERIAEAVIALSKLADRGRSEVAVIQGCLGLRVSVETVLAIPGQRTSDAVTRHVDRTITNDGGNVGRGSSVKGGEPADQRTGLVLFQQAVAPRPAASTGHIVVVDRCRGFGINLRVAAPGCAPRRLSCRFFPAPRFGVQHRQSMSGCPAAAAAYRAR